MRVSIDGIGLWGPGLEGWIESREVLAQQKNYAFRPAESPKPSLLSAKEQRRAGNTIKLAIEAALQATEQSSYKPDELACVFSASAGDLEILDYICESLAGSEIEKRISPTKFHNSVHNAAAGYWAIGTQCRKAINCISGGKASFAMGLLEAIVYINIQQEPVLLVVYDIASPPPLNQAYAVDEMFAVSFVLAPEQKTSHHQILDCDGLADNNNPESNMQNSALEKIRLGNPSARCLPLLAALAESKNETVILPAGPAQQLKVTVSS